MGISRDAVPLFTILFTNLTLQLNSISSNKLQVVILHNGRTLHIRIEKCFYLAGLKKVWHDRKNFYERKRTL